MRLIRAVTATMSAVALIYCATITGANAQSVGVSLNLGSSHVVAAYNANTHGDWHTSYTNWQPTTLYYYKGQYYDHSAKGARAVSVYKKDDGYFLPPQDKKWVGADKRFDYKHKPTSADYKRVP